MSELKDYKFKIGDVVMLNSGGPNMTVWNNRRDDSLVDVVWFNDNKQLSRDAFAEAELKEGLIYNV